MDEIAIVLPAYNEEATIEDTIRDFHAAMPEATFVIVDNASTDGTAARARACLNRISARGQVVSEPRPGKGNALRRGFHSVDAAIYLVADADFTYPAKHAQALIQPIRDNQADMVVGDRMSEGRYRAENKRPFHNLGNKLVCGLINVLFDANLKDIMSGYRALSRSFARNYPILVEGFQIETDMSLYALDKRFRVMEIPVEYRDRPAGSQSKLNTFGDGALVLMTILKVFRHYRPMTFFGGIALLLLLCSFVAGIPVIQDWLNHQYIYHLPLAILASGLAVLASLSFALGLILDSIVYQNRMRLEREIQITRSPQVADSGQ